MCAAREEIEMKKAKDDEIYTELFLSFSDKVERWIKRSLLVLLAALCLFQLLLRIPELRYVLATADKYEGVPIHREQGN
ncbi:hypothetical protein POTG_03143 [Paenibacillus sp. oral taxon 786 str. D14]|nr:hypothetical protein POTG_03143 [Paenibacillus sp. oral taxon 786 str. D14]